MRLENASRRAKFFLERVPQRGGEFWRRFRRRWGQDREVDEGGHGWKEACQCLSATNIWHDTSKDAIREEELSGGTCFQGGECPYDDDDDDSRV